MEPKPQTVEVILEHIPEELIDRPRWVGWKWEWKQKEKKWTKPPYDVKTGKKADVTDPSTWASLDTVYREYKANNYDGIGFVLNKEYTGFDFDDSRDPCNGQIFEPSLSEIVKLNSYTEISPGSKGLKTLTRAKLPKGGHHKNRIGVFDSDRYFCITGNVIEGVSKKIESRQPEVDSFIRRFYPNDFDGNGKPRRKTSGASFNISDADLIQKAMNAANGEKFKRLWEGDHGSYSSPSEADLALCTILAFWTGKDPGWIDRLFRSSGLMREKWNEPHFSDGRTYGEATIKEAVERTSEVYSGFSKGRNTGGPIQSSIVFPKEAITGVAGEFADLYSRYLEPPWSFFAFDFLTWLGNIITSRITLASEISPQPRLYTANIGESADDRKSEAIKQTTNFFETTFGQSQFKVSDGVGSAEGLGRKFKEIPTSPRRLLLAYDELKAFVSKATIDGSTLLPTVNSLFESNRLHSTTKTHSTELDDVHLSLIGASTLDTFARMWTPAFLDVGFINRLWLVSDRGERKFSIPREIPRSEILPVQVKLTELVKSLPASQFRLPVAEEARSIFDQWYFRREPSPFAKRLDTYGLRFMILLAVNEGTMIVTPQIAEKVVKLLEWQLEVRRECSPVDAEGNIAKQEEMIRRALHKGPMKERDLKRKVHYDRFGISTWRHAIENLLREGEVSFDRKHRTYMLN